MENYRLTQTGEEVQDILNGAAMQTDLTAENERAEGAEQTIQGNIDEEERRAKAAEETLSGAIGDEELRAKAAEDALGDAIDGINAKIPAAASSENKLADQDFVNSSIETATATFRGTYNLVSDLHLAVDATHAQIATLLGTVIAEADNNDYSYVLVPTSAQTPTEIASIEKYTFGANGWAFAYALNNSGFTSAQWAAINSGITSGLVAKLNALPTNTDLLALLAGKQDVLTFDDVPVEDSNNPVKSGGVYSAIDDEKTARVNAVNGVAGRVDTIEGEIPAQASSENQLADKAYVNSSISTNTATYRGSFNLVADLGLSVSATHEQIGTALAGEISTADNNDYAYVQVPTSDETPSQILKVERYKFNGTAWAFEYELNNSGFTSAQWAALNSGITSGLVGKLNALPTNDELTLALAGKQDVLTFDNTPTENSNNPVKSGGVYAADKALSDAIEAILLLIPSAATSLNKLVDTDLMNSSISTATATFRGTFNLVSDLSLDLTATHAQIATALAGAIATADNNDYAFVQVPTAVGTPTEIAQTDRYKFNGTAWAFEYTLNNSGFTSVQWAAINSGITAALVASLADIPDLIPSEATSANQLADKAYVLAQILAATPAFKGQFVTLAELQAVASPKAGDLGIVRTKDSDGMDVFTVYQYLNNAWNVFYSLSYHPQTKPATTGTTGDYPYNGMGRVELAKNMVNTGTDLDPVMVNTLTQDMFYKGAVGSRVPNTNTIFVIRYDYVLAENITIPDNCVLEFEGGSISGAYTITGANTIIEGEKNITCTMAGTFSDRSLSTLRGEVTSLKSAVGSGGSVDGRIAQAKTEIIGGANSDYNTLGKTENKLLAEVSRAETVEAQLQQAYAGITQSDIIVGSLPASGTANKIYRVPGSGVYTDYMYYDGSFVQMAEYTADTFAHKSYLSPTPIFNSIFKEFLIQGQSFDITQVTSMYIDKAMYRDSGVYRDQIVLKVGDDEVTQFTIDSETSAKALSVFPNDVINYGVDINGSMLYFIMDWSSLASNQRHTFNVTLNEGCAKEECNPTIYSFLNNENSYFGFSNIGWGNFAVNGNTGELTDADRYRFTSGKIYIPKNSVILNFSGLSAGYKYELYFFDFNDNIVRTYEGWKTTSDVYTFPDTAAYLRIMVAKASDPQFFVYDLINDNQNVTIVFTQNDRKYTLCELTVGNMNVRGFADTEESSQKSDNPSVYLPLWKRVMTWVNKDFLTIVEWQDDFDKAGNINSYNTLLKQFYPYHYTINGERGLFSKIPCTFEVRTRNYNQIVAKTTINGKSLAIVAWVQSNSDDAAKVRADSQWMIDYLTDFDLVIVSGDFNNEAGASLLQVWLDNGYILGNSGYWGQIDTCTSSTNPDYAANDNIVVKGFASYDNFEKGSEKVGSDHYPVRADLHYYI